MVGLRSLDGAASHVSRQGRLTRIPPNLIPCRPVASAPAPAYQHGSNHLLRRVTHGARPPIAHPRMLQVAPGITVAVAVAVSISMISIRIGVSIRISVSVGIGVGIDIT